MINNNNEVSQDIFNFILDNVKLLIGLEDLPENPTKEEEAKYDNIIAKLTFYINYLCKDIKIQTNRNHFPEDLKYLVINLVCDAYDINIKETSDNNEVKSMSEGGRTVTFGAKDAYKIKLQSLAAQQLASNQKQINRYRLMYKTRCMHDE